MANTTYKATIITPDDETYSFGPYEALSPTPLSQSKVIGRLEIPLAARDLPASLALATLPNDDYEIVITFSQPDETISVGGDIVATRPSDTWVQVTVDIDEAP